jgi:hypothetical protein
MTLSGACMGEGYWPLYSDYISISQYMRNLHATHVYTHVDAEIRAQNVPNEDSVRLAATFILYLSASFYFSFDTFVDWQNNHFTFLYGHYRMMICLETNGI